MWEKVSAFQWVLKTVGYVCLLSLGQLIQVETLLSFWSVVELNYFVKMSMEKCPSSNVTPHLNVHFIQFVVIPLPTAMEFQQRKQLTNLAWTRGSWGNTGIQGSHHSCTLSKWKLLSFEVTPGPKPTSVFCHFFTVVPIQNSRQNPLPTKPSTEEQVYSNLGTEHCHSVCPTSFGGTAAKGWMTAARGMRACLAMSELTGKQ